MANTENKRRSALAVLPAPDSAIGAADRRQVTWNYSGIAAAVADSVARYWTRVGAVTAVWSAKQPASSTWVARPASSSSWVTTQKVGQD